jgi:hypothetical protein
MARTCAPICARSRLLAAWGTSTVRIGGVRSLIHSIVSGEVATSVGSTASPSAEISVARLISAPPSSVLSV